MPRPHDPVGDSEFEVKIAEWANQVIRGDIVPGQLVACERDALPLRGRA